MPTNLYGPNDNFDLSSSPRAAGADPQVPRRQGQPARDEVEIWGTGSPRREFLHVDDLADACLFLMDHYDEAQHINVGTGEDLTIRELAETGARRRATRRASCVFDTTQARRHAPQAARRIEAPRARLAPPHRAGSGHRFDLRLVPRTSVRRAADRVAAAPAPSPAAASPRRLVPLRIAFDMDGVLADMDGALLRHAEALFGAEAVRAITPVNAAPPVDPVGRTTGGEPNRPPGPDPADDPPASTLRLNDRQHRRLWQHVATVENFWESLQEIEPGSVARLGALPPTGAGKRSFSPSGRPAPARRPRFKRSAGSRRTASACRACSSFRDLARADRRRPRARRGRR